MGAAASETSYIGITATDMLITFHDSHLPSKLIISPYTHKTIDLLLEAGLYFTPRYRYSHHTSEILYSITHQSPLREFVFSEGDVVTAVYMRSGSALLKAIESNPTELVVDASTAQDKASRLSYRAKERGFDCLTGQEMALRPLYHSTDWPLGHRILLEKGCPADDLNASKTSPLRHAISYGNLDTTKLLMSAGCRLRDGEGHILDRPISFLRAVEAFDYVIAEMAREVHLIMKLAKTTLAPTTFASLDLPEDRLPCQKIDAMLKLLECHKGTSNHRLARWNRTQSDYDVFRIRSLDVDAAARLYSAGFRDVAQESYPHQMERHFSPLVLVLEHHNWWTDLKNNFELCLWMKSKGAKLIERISATPLKAGHLLGFRLGEMVSMVTNCSYHIDPVSLECRKWLEHSSSRVSSDGCSCACSSKGCGFVHCSIKRMEFGRAFIVINPNVFMGKSYPRGISYRSYCHFLSERRFIVKNERSLVEMRNFIVWISPECGRARWFVIEIIRSITFDTLDLSHTCHGLRYPDLFMLNPRITYTLFILEEAKEIWEEQRYLLCLLKKLVLEFEAKYDELRLDLMYFVDKYWLPRMRAVYKRLKRQDRVHEQHVRGTGVVFEENHSDCESEEEPHPLVIEDEFGEGLRESRIDFDFEEGLDELLDINDEPISDNTEPWFYCYDRSEKEIKDYGDPSECDNPNEGQSNRRDGTDVR